MAMEPTPIPMQHEFIAAPDTARRMSRAVLNLTPRSVLRMVAISAVVTVVLLHVTKEGQAWPTRLFAAGFWAALVTVVPTALLVALSYGLTLRNLRRTSFAGALFRTGFGEAEFVIEGPLSSSRLSYDAVESVRSVSEFVIIRYLGQTAARIYPAELFPSDVIDRLERSAARASSRRQIPWAWLIIGVCVVAAAAELRSGRDEAAFCADLHRIDGPVAALRQAKADEAFDAVPGLVLKLRSAYQSIDPPPAIRTDWATAIAYVDLLHRSALAVQEDGGPLEPPAGDNARFSAAMTAIADFAVETCADRRRGVLVP